MATQIYLVRHGQTAWSVTGQHTGHTDLPLTPHGEQRAQEVGKLLSAVSFSHVLVSPLQRARESCRLAGLGAQARVEPNLREWDYGDYEGRTAAQIRAERPSWNIYRDGCPNGESAQQVSARSDLIVAELHRLDGCVAIFSHGQFLRALAVRWIELPIDTGVHFGLDTSSLSVLGREHNNVETTAIVFWNAVSNAVFDVKPHQGPT